MEPTDLTRLKVISEWLANDNELPSSGDANCVADAGEEILFLRQLINDQNWKPIALTKLGAERDQMTAEEVRIVQNFLA